MKSLLEKLKESLANEETKRCLHFLTLPFVTILLIIVIVIADKPDKNGGTASVPQEAGAVQAQGGSQSADGNQVPGGVQSPDGNQVPDAVQNPGDVPAPGAFQESGGSQAPGSSQDPESGAAGGNTDPKSAVYQPQEAAPEVLEMMEKYFKARKSCDVNKISAVYGGGLSSEQLEKERVTMEDEVRYYQNFHNLVCYTVPGLTADSLIVYARYDIKFRQAETEAPSMMACYAKSTGDGSWYLVAELTPEEAEYLDTVNHSDAVQSMASEVNTGLRSALESDENLLAVYYSLTAEPEAEETAPAGENGTGTENGTETGAGTGTETGNNAGNGTEGEPASERVSEGTS